MSVTWGQFAERDPELAALGEGQLARTGLALVGTLRRDGWPRISPWNRSSSMGTCIWE